jgi:transcriptional regulator with XRE-family HTH domain
MTYLELARRQHGWSQDKLSTISGVSQPLISLIEVGRGLPTVEQRHLLAKTLGIPPAILLKTVSIADIIAAKAEQEAMNPTPDAMSYEGAL